MALAITSLDAYGIRPYDQPVTITGTDFGATQITSKVYIADGTNFGTATLIEQTKITSWSATSISVAGIDPELFARGIKYFFVETVALGNSNAEEFFLGTRDVRVVQGSFLTPTSTGNLDVSHPLLLGDSKVKGIFLRANLVTAESAVDDAAIHLGMSDGTNDYAITTNTEDGVLDAYRQNWNDRCLSLIPVGGSDTPTVVATFTGAVTDGFRLNFTVVSGSAFLVQYIVFAGEDVQAEVSQSLVSGSSISGLAFRPEFGIVIGDGQGLNSNADIFLGSIGMFNDDLDQFQIGWYGPDSGAARPPLSMASGAGVALQVVGTSKTWQMTVTSIQSDGFTWSGSNGDNIYALTVNLSNIGVSIEQFTKTSGGSDPVTQALPDLGFIPQSLGIGTAWRTSTGLSTGDALATLGFWDMFNQGHIAWIDEDVDEPNNSHMRSQTDALGLKMLTNGGTDVEMFGAQVGIDTAPDVIYNPNDTSADIMFVFAFEQVVEHLL